VPVSRVGKTQLKLMNLHILILISLNGHKISRPQQQLDTEALSQSETFCEEYSKFSKLAFESAVSSKTAIEQNSDFSVSVSEYERKVLRPGRSICISFSCTKYYRKLYADNFFSKLSRAKDSSPISLKSSKLKWENLLPLMGEGSPILSTKSSIFFYKSGNNKALLDKNSLTTNSKTG